MAALEVAGLLRPEADAPPIRDNIQVVSLNTTLATGILIGKAGNEYKTQADLVSFFAQIQAWYGDTAKWSGDPNAKIAEIDYMSSVRMMRVILLKCPYLKTRRLSKSVQWVKKTYFLDFNVYAGGKSELEYLRHIGQLDDEFKPIGPKALSLTQYLQQIAAQTSKAAISVKGPRAIANSEGISFLPSGVSLPYQIAFNNTSEQNVKQIR